MPQPTTANTSSLSSKSCLLFVTSSVIQNLQKIFVPLRVLRGQYLFNFFADQRLFGSGTRPVQSVLHTIHQRPPASLNDIRGHPHRAPTGFVVAAVDDGADYGGGAGSGIYH